MADAIAAMRGVPVNLLTDASATTATSTIVSPPVSFLHHKIIIKTSSGTASGAIQIEASEDNTYTGTWAPVTTAITVPAASSESEFNFIGVYKFIRTRISTTIGSGTVTTIYVGAPN